MYSEWVSLQTQIQNDKAHFSVLKKFPSTVSHDIVLPVVKSISQAISINGNDQPSKLATEDEVDWTMQILCFGLSLPFNDHEYVKECVNIYCDWMSCLQKPKLCVPKPIQEKPIPYAMRIISHLYNLFVPREKSTQQDISRQVLLCHRTLRMIETVAKDSAILTREFWEHCLRFLLAITDTLLAPPKEKESLNGEMAERVISVLFDIWLLSCSQAFPVPSLWRTFRDMCSNWRHYDAVIVQWNRVNLALTEPMLKQLYGNTHPILLIPSADQTAVKRIMEEMVSRLSPESVVQCWFRFLHILSNPVDLAQVETISETPKFLHHALTSEKVIEPHQHPCLQQLPQIFYRAMKAVSHLSDAFLGCCQEEHDLVHTLIPLHRQSTAATTGTQMTSGNNLTTGLTPPLSAKLNNRSTSLVLSPSARALSPGKTVLQPNPVASPSYPSIPTPLLSYAERIPAASTRSSVDSILHLLGAWLFEASLCHVSAANHRPGSVSHRTGSLNSPGEVQRGDFSQGRAEACATLARLFCAKKTGEKIRPVYLARFYMSMYHALALYHPIPGRVLTFSLFHLADAFRVDLPSVNTLIPRVIPALENVLNTAQHPFSIHDQIPLVELRRACIHIVMSIMCLPLQLGSIELKDLYTGELMYTYISLKSRVAALILNSLSMEKDSENIVMLLSTLTTLTLDFATHEYREYDRLSSDTGSIRSVDHLSYNLHQGEIVNQVDRQGSSVSQSDKVNGSHDPENVPNPPVLMRRPSKLDDYNTAGGLLSTATTQICTSLIKTWKSDHLLALSALEVLTSLSKVKLQIISTSTCKSTTLKICSLISHLCNRPPRYHNRDLHSLIVASFLCLSHWLLEHSYLLQDKEVLYTTLEVIELGISGKKSQQSFNSDDNLLKGAKDHMPVSLRVKDAAEALLMTMNDQLDCFPTPSGAETLYPMVDESDFLLENPGSKFTYFALHNNNIVAIMDYSFKHGNRVPVIIRGPFGRQAWIVEPKYKSSGSHSKSAAAPRPQPAPEVISQPRKTQKCWPSSVHKISLVKADCTIPTMDDLDPLEPDFEAIINKHMSQPPIPTPRVLPKELRQPEATEKFQAARSVISQLGLLSTFHSANSSPSSVPLSQLNSKADGFVERLAAIDAIPNRTCDTAYVFYVSSGQTQVADLLDNTKSYKNLAEGYKEFLTSLGWPVSVNSHPGWNGTLFKGPACKNRLGSLEPTERTIHLSNGPASFDGTRWILYWADAKSEIAFIVPTEDRINMNINLEKKDLPREDGISNSTDEAVNPVSSPKDKRTFSSDVKVIIVWLERVEDKDSIPRESLLNVCSSRQDHPLSSEYLFIYITALESGLLRVQTMSHTERCSTPLPLVDGAVVSRRVIGPLIRQTAINVSNRKRLLHEISQIPHNKRQQKVQEMITQYRVQSNETQFHQQLFAN